jgi:hypothetical protein
MLWGKTYPAGRHDPRQWKISEADGGGRAAPDPGKSRRRCRICRRRSLGTSGRKVPDLAEDHVLEIQGPPAGNGCDPGGPRGGRRRVGQRVRHQVRRTWYIYKLVGVFRNECKVALLAARGQRSDSVEGKIQGFVIRAQLEGAALQP